MEIIRTERILSERYTKSLKKAIALGTTKIEIAQKRFELNKVITLACLRDAYVNIAISI